MRQLKLLTLPIFMFFFELSTLYGAVFELETQIKLSPPPNFFLKGHDFAIHVSSQKRKKKVICTWTPLVFKLCRRPLSRIEVLLVQELLLHLEQTFLTTTHLDATAAPWLIPKKHDVKA